jgi:hypothetical protein
VAAPAAGGGSLRTSSHSSAVHTGFFRATPPPGRGYRVRSHAIEARLPAGVGSHTDDFTTVYQDAFQRIVVHNEDIPTVLDDEARLLQAIVTEADARCWPPDHQSGGGPCQIA